MSKKIRSKTVSKMAAIKKALNAVNMADFDQMMVDEKEAYFNKQIDALAAKFYLYCNSRKKFRFYHDDALARAASKIESALKEGALKEVDGGRNEEP